LKSAQLKSYILACYLKVEADLNPAFHFDADPDPAYHVYADSTVQFNVDPDPDPQGSGLSVKIICIPEYFALTKIY